MTPKLIYKSKQIYWDNIIGLQSGQPDNPDVGYYYLLTWKHKFKKIIVEVLKSLRKPPTCPPTATGGHWIDPLVCRAGTGRTRVQRNCSANKKLPKKKRKKSKDQRSQETGERRGDHINEEVRRAGKWDSWEFNISQTGNLRRKAELKIQY